MAYRKIQGDQLFDGVKMFDQEDPRILIYQESGEIEAILPAREAGEDIQKVDGLLCPGFVNTHCHLELSHMEGVIPTGTGMVEFLIQVMTRRDEGASDHLQAARLADQQMYEGGIVAVGDISNLISSLPIKAGSLLHYHTFVEVAGFVPSAAEARLGQARQVYKGMRMVLGPDQVNLVPHAPYSVSKPLFEALDAPGLTSIHNQESQAENAFYKSKEGDFLKLYETLGLNLDFYKPYGTSSLQTWLPWMKQPQKLLLVHNVASAAEDIDFALGLSRQRKQQLFWSLCPGANLYIQEVMPPLRLLREKGCQMTLGTDSLASNHQLSILTEMQLIQEHFPEVPLAELLGWATRNGAAALNLEHSYGRFAKGFQPGVLLLTGLEGEKIGPGTRVRRLV
jgi:cytosine/adenosine deaminase-related metal-dependent hydrolase